MQFVGSLLSGHEASFFQQYPPNVEGSLLRRCVTAKGAVEGTQIAKPISNASILLISADIGTGARFTEIAQASDWISSKFASVFFGNPPIFNSHLPNSRFAKLLICRGNGLGFSTDAYQLPGFQFGGSERRKALWGGAFGKF